MKSNAARRRRLTARRLIEGACCCSTAGQSVRLKQRAAARRGRRRQQQQQQRRRRRRDPCNYRGQLDDNDNDRQTDRAPQTDANLIDLVLQAARPALYVRTDSCISPDHGHSLLSAMSVVYRRGVHPVDVSSPTTAACFSCSVSK